MGGLGINGYCNISFTQILHDSVGVADCAIQSCSRFLEKILGIMPGTTLMGMVGFLILAMLIVAIITSRIMWKKGIIKVVDKEEA